MEKVPGAAAGVQGEGAGPQKAYQERQCFIWISHMKTKKRVREIYLSPLMTVLVNIQTQSWNAMPQAVISFIGHGEFEMFVSILKPAGPPSSCLRSLWAWGKVIYLQLVVCVTERTRPPPTLKRS